MKSRYGLIDSLVIKLLHPSENYYEQEACGDLVHYMAALYQVKAFVETVLPHTCMHTYVYTHTHVL